MFLICFLINNIFPVLTVGKRKTLSNIIRIFNKFKKKKVKEIFFATKKEAF